MVSVVTLTGSEFLKRQASMYTCEMLFSSEYACPRVPGWGLLMLGDPTQPVDRTIPWERGLGLGKMEKLREHRLPLLPAFQV